MNSLPPRETPLNQHSLESIEYWLIDIGAKKSSENPCLWEWSMPYWSALIKMEVENISIIWQKNGEQQQCTFPYGLSREDVESAFFQGP